MDTMDLPVAPPVDPMLAKAAATVPSGSWSYEPKWDGFLHWICQPSLGDLPLRGACSGGQPRQGP